MKNLSLSASSTDKDEQNNILYTFLLILKSSVYSRIPFDEHRQLKSLDFIKVLFV